MTERRIEREAVLRCDPCNAAPYVLYRRAVKPDSPIYVSVLWPAHPSVPPPSDPARPACPTCGKDLRRVAA